MNRWASVTLLTTAVLFWSALAPAQTKTDTIKIGTLAPADSPWGQVYKVWQRAIRERTKLPNGEKTADGKEYTLDATIFWNGQQGDEGGMVAKMKSGQLDAASITSVGLAQIYRPILVLQIPGVFIKWDKLDSAREALRPEFEKAVSAAGFTITGWGDVGLARTMSKGFPLVSVADLRGKKPYMWREDPITPIFFQVMGGVTAVPGSIPEVLPMLNTGAINVLSAPALAAEQLQWASRLDHINTEVITAVIGGSVITNKKLESLTADQRTVLVETQKVSGAALTNRIRNEDVAAYNRMKTKMEVSTPNEAQIKEWTKIFQQAIVRLEQGTFPKELVERAVKLGGFDPLAAAQ